MDLLFTGHSPMIIAPYILCEVERQPLTPDASFGSQAALEVAPEAFQTIDMSPPRPVEVALAMVDEPVHVPLRRDARVVLPGIGTDDRAALDAAPDEWQQGLRLNIGDDLRPHLPAPAEDPEDGGLGGPAASLRAGPAVPGALVLPGAPQVGLVDLDRPAEHRRNLMGHGLPHAGQRPQDALPMQARLLGDGGAAGPAHEPPQELSPLVGGQTQWQLPRSPRVAAARTAALLPSENPVASTRTSRAFQSSRHATRLAD